jgi:hypothetical protein
MPAQRLRRGRPRIKLRDCPLNPAEVDARSAASRQLNLWPVSDERYRRFEPLFAERLVRETAKTAIRFRTDFGRRLVGGVCERAKKIPSRQPRWRPFCSVQAAGLKPRGSLNRRGEGRIKPVASAAVRVGPAGWIVNFAIGRISSRREEVVRGDGRPRRSCSKDTIPISSRSRW